MKIPFTSLQINPSFKAKNFGLLPIMSGIKGQPENIPMVESDAHKPRNFVVPLQLQRVTQDISTWLASVSEAENAYYPHRFRMQQLFINKILEGHTFSCMEKRKSLSLMKDFIIQDAAGKENEELTKIFKNKQWFLDLCNFILDAQFYGYSLIQLGELVEAKGVYDFKDLTILKRWHVSPDRLQYTQIPYATWGLNFLDPSEKDSKGVSFSDWLVYVPTPSDVGSSICGFGLLFKAAIYGIILSDNLGNNATYTERYSTPYRHVKTAMTLNEDAMDELQNGLQNMGANGFIITKDGITIDFKETNTGNGYKSYESLEKRCENKITTLFLGHADAISSVPGKLGSGQGGGKPFDEDTSPIGRALAVVEKQQDQFLLNVLNNTVLPKFRRIGFRIPEGFMFSTTQDKEEMEARIKEDQANDTTADIAVKMKNAGLQMDAKYFQERTGIPTTVAPLPEPPKPPAEEEGNAITLKKRMPFSNRMNKIYGNGYHHPKAK